MAAKTGSVFLLEDGFGELVVCPFVLLTIEGLTYVLGDYRVGSGVVYSSLPP